MVRSAITTVSDAAPGFVLSDMSATQASSASELPKCVRMPLPTELSLIALHHSYRSPTKLFRIPSALMIDWAISIVEVRLDIA